MANIDLSKIVEINSVNELDPITQQPAQQVTQQLIKGKSKYTPININTKDYQFNKPPTTNVGDYFQGSSQYDIDIPPSRIYDSNIYRAERQPWYDQAANFLNQAGVGEVIGGTLMSLGAILEAPDMIMNTINGTEQEFSNGLYELGNSISEWTKDVTPIYQTGGRFADSGWWWQNGVSVASTLSMMIPGMAASKVTGGIANALKLGTTASKIAQTGIGALTMRHAENFREAHDVFNTIYSTGINNGKSHEESLKAASDAAAMDYKSNYVNLAFDVIQMASILRPFEGLTRNTSISGKLANAADDLLSKPKYTPTSKVGKLINRIKDPAKIGLSEWTEGIEEGVNTLSQFESTRQGRIDLGLEQDDNSTFGDRLKEYLGTEEMQDSMIWGMIGGMAFKGLAQITGFDENAGITKNKLDELASRGEKLNHYGKVINAIINSSVVTSPTGEVIQDYTKIKPDEKAGLLADVKESMIKDLAFSAAKAGNVDILLEQIKDPKFIETLANTGIGSKEDITKEIPEIVSKIEKYESIFSKYYSNLFESPIDSRAKSVLVDRFSNIESILLRNEEALKEINSNKNKLLANDAWYQTQSNKEDVDTAIESFALLLAKKSLSDALREKGIHESTRKAAEKAIANIDKRIASIKAVNKPVSIAAIDKRIMDNAAEAIEIEEFNNGLSEVLSELSKPENIVKEAKEIKKNTDELVKILTDNKVNSENNKASTKREESKAKVEEVIEAPVETGNEASLEDFEDIPQTESPDKNSTLEDKIDNTVAKIKENWDKELKSISLTQGKKGDIVFDENGQEFIIDSVDKNGKPTSVIDAVSGKKAEISKLFVSNPLEINKRYQALLDNLPTTNEVSQATVNKVVEDSTFEDGNNVEVSPKSIEIEESNKLIDRSTLKRNIGLAINYLVSKFTAKGNSLSKETIDIKESNPDALVASEWKEFTPGTKVILSLDTQFDGEVYQYIGEDKVSRVLKDGKPEVYRRTFNEIFAEDKINAPIKIQVEKDGKLITVGYLPTISWLKSVDNNNNYENLSNNKEYPADEQIERVRKVRKIIVNGELDKTYEFTVIEKGLGKLAITTEKDSNNKKVLNTVSMALPNLITSEYFSGTVQPFAIFNQEFFINKDTQFSGVVAISDATRQALKEDGAGAVFMMIPTAKPGVFIPTPVAVPLIPKNIATMLSEVVSAVAFEDNPELLNKIRFNYGINITSRKNLKEFLEKFLYFTSPEEVKKTYGDGRVRISFDTKNSLIIVNNGDGKGIYKIALNTAKTNEGLLELNIMRFKESLANTKMSIKLNQINSTEGFSVPVIAENGDINFEEYSYNQFLADNIKTDLVELTSANGTPVYVVQPVIEIDDAFTPEESKPEPTYEELSKDLEDIDFSDFTIEDELLGTNESEKDITKPIKSNLKLTNTQEDNQESVDTKAQQQEKISQLFESNPELANEIYEILEINTQNTINDIIQSIPEIIEVEYSNNLSPSEGGRFETGGEIPVGKGKIIINKNLDKKIQEEALAHELVHGILQLKYKETLNPNPKIEHKNIGTKYEHFYATYFSYGVKLGKRFNTKEEAEEYIKRADFQTVNFKGSELEKELKNIWKTLPKEKIDPVLIKYINKNIEELITYTLTNKDFAKILNKIQYKGEIVEYKKNTIFQVIIDLFSKIIPIKGSAYDKILSILNQYSKNIDIDNQITSQQKQQAQEIYIEYLQSLNKPDVNPELFKDEKINESEIVYTDEQGNLCAKNGGRSSKFTKGSQWKIVKDLKGYPSHANGGVDITLGKDGFSFKGKNGYIKAAHGLVLPFIGKYKIFKKVYKKI